MNKRLVLCFLALAVAVMACGGGGTTTSSSCATECCKGDYPPSGTDYECRNGHWWDPNATADESLAPAVVAAPALRLVITPVELEAAIAAGEAYAFPLALITIGGLTAEESASAVTSAGGCLYDPSMTASPEAGYLACNSVPSEALCRTPGHHPWNSPECNPEAAARVNNARDQWGNRNGETNEPQNKGDMRCVATFWGDTIIRYGIFVALKWTDANIKGDLSFFVPDSGWLTAYGNAKWRADALTPANDLLKLGQQYGVAVENRQVPCNSISGELPLASQAAPVWQP